MANRKIQLDVKVQVMRECLRLDAKRVEATMRKHQLSERSAFRWFEQILERLPEILKETKPGPKSQPPSTRVPPRRRNRLAKP